MAKATKELRGLSLVKSEQYWIISKNYSILIEKKLKKESLYQLVFIY
jgi:hypothetical protein